MKACCVCDPPLFDFSFTSEANPFIYKNDLLFDALLLLSTGFPRGIESIEKVLNFKIHFQDLEKELNLAKMCIRY